MDDIRNRVIEMRVISGRDLLGHDDNPRTHPLFQRKGVRGSVNETGITDVLRAYHSERNGGKLTLLDGHVRREEFPDLVWPVIILDLTDEEADKQLLVEDGLGMLAEYDPVKVKILAERARIKNSDLIAAAERLKARVAPQIEAMKKMAEEKRAATKTAVSDNFQAIRQTAVRLVVAVDDVSVIEQALAAAGTPNRADALAIVCRRFLENK